MNVLQTDSDSFVVFYLAISLCEYSLEWFVHELFAVYV